MREKTLDWRSKGRRIAHFRRAFIVVDGSCKEMRAGIFWTQRIPRRGTLVFISEHK